MDRDFWLQKWQIKQIGFHRSQPHSRLLQFVDRLELSQGDTIFVPLCGKSIDIHWLLAQGYKVVGVELSEIAVTELFEELGLEPEITSHGQLKVYQSGELKVYQGDFFELQQSDLTEVKAVYDRAALVALPPEMRVQYAQHMRQIIPQATQLIITFDYDVAMLAGPPFCVPAEEVEGLYSQQYNLELLLDASLQGGLKGKVPAREVVWLVKSPRRGEASSL